MGKFDRRVNMAGKARLGFGIRAKSGRAAGFVGGAYIYIDPTPSKNVLESIPDVVPRSMCAIPAHGMSAAYPLPRAGHGMNAIPPYA
jgi:hypothetical protein